MVVHHVSPIYFGEEGGTTDCTLTVTWRFEAPVPLIVKGGMARTIPITLFCEHQRHSASKVDPMVVLRYE